MVLELHVWGPGFGLPSIDPECLAAIAYFTQALDKPEWTLVQSSPSAVPTHRLPALHATSSSTWTAGLPSITAHLRATSPPTFRDPDATLPLSARADLAAYSAHLRGRAAPLLGLSLYVSPANWAHALRPAHSAVLPAPLAWTEAGLVRAAWVRAADRAGLADLDDDRAAEEGDEARARGEHARRTAGWLPTPATPAAPEAERKRAADAAARLEAAAGDVLDVLQTLKSDDDDGGGGGGGGRWLLGAGPSSLDCLAFGYLALMLAPGLPRPWLGDLLRRRYGSLCVLVDDVRVACLGGGDLPWAAARTPRDTVAGVALRLARGAVFAIPGVGGELRRWWEGGRTRRGAGALAVAGGVLAAAAAVVAIVFRKEIPALGAPVQRWDRARTGLLSFGAAGAMFSVLSEAAHDGGVGVGA